MPTHTVDLESLYLALDEKRRREGKTWRQLTRELDLGPTRFSWMAEGGRINVDTFVTLLAWLEVDAERFVRPANRGGRLRPHARHPSS
jgi:hypothetical protein